jgi:hypothetical protein
MQHGDLLRERVRLARVVKPGIDRIRIRMAFQMKHFDDPVPNSLTSPRLFHGNALTVGGLPTVESVNHFPQLFDMGQIGSLQEAFLGDRMPEMLNLRSRIRRWAIDSGDLGVVYALFNISGPLFRTFPTRGFAGRISISCDSNGRSKSTCGG